MPADGRERRPRQIERQLRSGKLFKRGRRRKNWKERTFILSKRDADSHAMLRYFDTSGAVKGEVCARAVWTLVTFACLLL